MGFDARQRNKQQLSRPLNPVESTLKQERLNLMMHDIFIFN